MHRELVIPPTHITPKGTALLLGKYQSMYVIFRKRMLLEGAVV